MTEAGLKSAHFLSLDVEGAEDLVLEAADPSKFELVSHKHAEPNQQLATSSQCQLLCVHR